jgi:hypothetical protein
MISTLGRTFYYGKPAVNGEIEALLKGQGDLMLLMMKEGTLLFLAAKTPA